MTDLTFHPLTPERWPDLEALFGPRGAYGGCWCMFWRQTRSEFERLRGETNRQLFKALVEAGLPTGILAYDAEKPVGWCAVAPREEYGSLSRSRVLKPVDDQPVWSVTCFFVARGWRRRGVTVGLLRAAADHVRAMGGSVMEGYPTRPRMAQADPFVYMGTESAFLQAGFTEAARPSPSRSIMRRSL